MSTYNSKLVTITVNGRFMTGFRDGDIYSYDEGDDRAIEYKGSDGTVDYSIKPTNECMITIGFKQSSPSLRYLHGLYDNQTPLSVTVMDSNPNGEKISGENGVFQKRPVTTRSKEISEQEIVIMLPDHKYEKF